MKKKEEGGGVHDRLQRIWWLIVKLQIWLCGLCRFENKVGIGLK
jgi:hypothetical protein